MWLLAPFGPDYPDLGAAVTKYRRKAKQSVFDLSDAERAAYAKAIETAIRAKQRAATQRTLPSHNVKCASGTNHSCGLKISEAVRAQHRSALQSYVAKVRRERTECEWREMYDRAMAQKNKREAA
jgi:hypothetical protein